MCTWTHDRVMQSFQPGVSDNTEQTHYEIGEKLRKSSLSMDSTTLVLIVDQLNLGASCMSDEAETLRLAEMNLDVREISVAQSAFAVGQQYFERGIALLPEDRWTNHRTLSLHLYSKAAEAAHNNGDSSKTMEMVDCILKTVELSKKNLLPTPFVSTCWHLKVAFKSQLKLQSLC